MYKILTDQDIEQLASMERMVQAIERCLREEANGTLVAPPRFRVTTEKGDLVFTAGAATAFDKVIGFRVYDTYDNDVDGHEQLVCVFDSDTGVFQGIVIGNLLGAIRTGAIGGAAVRALARVDAKQVAVIGTGVQARTQLAAAVAVRNIQRVKVYSRHREHREAFAREMAEKLHVDVSAADSSRACIEDADILLCATNSDTPVFDMDDLKPGMHINTVGPKSVNRHEVPLAAADVSAVIATDSLEQLRAYATPHFLVGTPHEHRIQSLADLVTGRATGRTSTEDITLFCSVGLAATEVVAAQELMKM
ncbi:ornithine cyclodeaminase family protein [Alicyclobacillus cycloheptanicus]|uniref:Ornithine cyclodeaminase n=1 Tax=Alicyclobacillus cycloheptanicus TaxID=1457 RepID=A0ABT9XEY2_9BACL|nr:ornithine cyclodeaminase family protein [Alicyclobacillus cycloheptanicus]MDQ0188859.1 ornithine cyclodeaminase [Alicyclobacillus cycloheptanicus]WDM00497.1 ornithine cyclodeaminase family protein [Alicyclobacillus cycloheptanicus]